MWIKRLLRPPYERASRWLYRRLAYIAWCEQQRELQSVLAKIGSCGPGLSVRPPIRLSGAAQLAIGSNVHIGENAFIRADAGLTIGDNTRISRNVVLYTVSHQYGGVRLPYDEDWIRKPVTIGKNVWIGMNVCIAPGTTIGDGAIVAMGTTVSGDVPALTIVGGQKWRTIGHRDPRHYESLEAAEAYGDPDGRPR
jgi:maltose O-acetyltransferase